MKFFEHGSKSNLSQNIVELFWHLSEKKLPGCQLIED
jgi:hypothetical protein